MGSYPEHRIFNNQLKEFGAMLEKKLLQTGVTVASLVAVVAVGTDQVAAHHGWSEYNNRQTLNLSGQIQSVGYDNPHATIQVQTADKKVWRAILAPPSRMQRRGLSQSALQVGQTVRLVGYPHRTESSEMRAERIIIGKRTVELR
jgi:hypothetical protein